MVPKRFPLLMPAFAAAVMFAGAGAPGPAAAFHLPAPCDTITASGTVAKASGAVVTFAATGGCKNGRFWGSLTFTDEETGFQLSSTDVTGYLWDPADPDAREICGVGLRGDGGDSMFRARLVDLGEPGRSDRFGVATDNRDTAGDRFYVLPAATLSAGNVKLHATNRSNSSDPAFAALQEWQMCGDLNSPQ